MKNKRVIFMGTPEFACNILQTLMDLTNVILVVSQSDKEVGRKKEIKFSPVKALAVKNNIEVFQPKKIKEEYQKIIDLKPDLIVTCAYGQIIPKEILECCTCINVHASLLPKLRGGAPIHWAIINGEKETGITLMYMNESMDEGDIIVQKSIKIDYLDNVGTLHDKLSVLGSELLNENLESIINKTNNRTQQNNDDATYAYTIKREDEHINFDDTALNIYNKIRGLYPFPIGYIVIDDEEIKILECEVGDVINEESSKITNIYKNGIGISTKDKEIIIKRLKPFGKKEMNAIDYINGKRKENLLGKKVC